MQQRPAALPARGAGCSARAPRWSLACAPGPSGRVFATEGPRLVEGAARATMATPTSALALRRRRRRSSTTLIARVANVSGGDASSNDDDPVPPQPAVTPNPEAAAAAVPTNANPTTKNPAVASAKAALSRAVDGLTRARWYSWYLERLEKQPTLTKAVTALCGFVIGDLVAQSISAGGSGGAVLATATANHHAGWLSHVDWARTARMGAFGLLVDGPVGGAYYAWLDRTIWPDDPLSPRTVLTKTVLDQTVYSALGTVAFFTFIRLLETGGDVSAVGPTLAAKFWPTLVANYTIWPLAHLINFRFVPPPLRVAYNQVVAVGWLTWLSLLAHSRAATAPAVAALAHKAAAGTAAAASGGGGGGLGGWLHSLLHSVLPHL